jgi:DNA-binding NarL/FixJ family response regulator
MARGAWEEARACFQAAAAADDCAEAQEGLSWVAWSLNEPALLFKAREAAFRLYREAGDDLGAARMAMWLGADYIDFRGEVSIASGWRQRARRLLEGHPVAPEHGWLAMIEGDVSLLVDEDTPKARQLALEVIQIGRSLDVTDLQVMGLALEGLARVSEGDVAAGMRLLDEAAVSALNGEVTEPGYVAWTLCYLIYACERVRDYDRAVQWCDRMREYAERSAMEVARGICRVHYAGVLIWRGDWQAAELELSDAVSHLSPQRPLLAADGTVRLAELRHRQGRLQEAETLFREVEWHPLALLGLAELSLEAGHPRDAEELIARFLRQVPESSRTQRAGALELLVRARALLGNHEGAAQALEFVRTLSASVATLPLQAASRFSAGALAIAHQNYEQAQACFEDAVDLYERSGAPYESARARLELASVLVMQQRLERAQSEVRAAQETLTRLNSIFYAGRAAALQHDIGRRLSETVTAPGLLTLRQVEILRLISQGLNDHEIAAALVVSEHTVHRHMANILQRLDLPSRAAAVAYASSRGLI